MKTASYTEKQKTGRKVFPVCINIKNNKLYNKQENFNEGTTLKKGYTSFLFMKFVFIFLILLKIQTGKIFQFVSCLFSARGLA